MKQKQLAGALGASLALAFMAAGIATTVATPPPERVLIKYKAGGKAQVQSELARAHASTHYTFDNIGVIAATVPGQALQGLRNNPNVEFVEPDRLRYPDAQTVPYGIDMVQARRVWDANRDGVIDPGAPTGQGILTCVIDSGIFRGHEDFQGVDVVGGYPAGKWDFDNCGHGTHVAGTIAAANNSVGVVGVTPGKTSLYIVKVFGDDRQTNCAWTYSSTLIDAANHCQQAGAKVINMSLGGSGYSRGEDLAFRALERGGILSIAAAGNHGDPNVATDAYHYPASYDSVVQVAAVDDHRRLASFSAKNDQTEIAGPGVDVLSTYPIGPAAPVVSGGEAYPSIPMQNTEVAIATAPLVSGGLCNTPLPAGDTSWQGKVVLCQRGSATFLTKSQNVFMGGGVAAVVYNNTTGDLNGTLGDDVSVIPPIPVVGVTQASGEDMLATHLGQSTTVDTRLPLNYQGYALLSGTSMSTPHVSGVAALVWSANPLWTNAQIRQALDASARDLGAKGYDTSYGWGLVQAQDALNALQGQ
jgi:subtilisin family serine protease